MTRRAFEKAWAAAVPAQDARCSTCRVWVRVGEECCGERLTEARWIVGTRAARLAKWESEVKAELVPKGGTRR